MRKLVIGSIVLVLGILGWSHEGLSEQPPAPRGELGIVGMSWVSIAWNVFEHLIEYAPDGTMVPGLATQWQWLDDRTLEVKLRQGVKFHNGEVFDAEIVKLNWEENIRLRQPHIAGAFMNFKPGLHLDIIDPYTVRFRFSEPDGGVMLKLSFLHIANRQFYRELGWGEKEW